MVCIRFGSLVLAVSASTLFYLNWNRKSDESEVSKSAVSTQKRTLWDNNWDNLGNDSPPVQTRRKKLIILVRHGQYHTDAKSAEQKVLTKRGWKQAISTGKRLRELGYKIDCIVHSDMVRARETTAAILSQLDQLQLTKSDLKELCYVTTPKDDDEIFLVRNSPLVSRSYPLLESPAMAEGPPPAEPVPASASSVQRLKEMTAEEMADRVRAQNRIERSFEQHIHRQSVCREGLSPSERTEVVLFVGHANVFRYWLCRALQLPLEAWLRISLPHGSITELLVEVQPPDRCTVTALRIGDDGHMPPALRSR